MTDSSYPESSVLTIERHDAVALLWLDRPEKLNAMAHAFWEDLPAVMEALSDDPGVRVVVIAGRGKAFSVGIDLQAFGMELMGGTGDMATGVGQRREFMAMLKRMQRTFTSVAECSKPVIAAIHGYCLGGGIDLISACDIRLAAGDAVFSVRETRMAMVADVGTLQRLPSIIDPGRLAELVYTGKDIGAEQAAEIGLLSHVYPDQHALMKESLALAEEIAANSPLAVQGAKAILRMQRRSAETESLNQVALWNSAFFHSNDLAEAIRAFLEKRPPRFEGD